MHARLLRGEEYHTKTYVISLGRSSTRQRPLEVDGFNSSSSRMAFPDQVAKILEGYLRLPLDLTYIFLLLLQLLHPSLQIDIELLSWEA